MQISLKENQKLQPRKQKGRKARKNQGGNRDSNSDLPVLDNSDWVRGLGVQFPDKVRVRLRFTEFIGSTITVGSSFITQRFRPTNVFDVDPVLGSTAVPGFQEMANIYGSYRTVASSCSLQASQNGTQSAMSIVVVPLNQDPGASPSSVVAASWYGAFGSKSALCSQIGGPPITIKNSMTTEKIFGTKAVYFDDNFSAPVTGGPTNNWYWAYSANLSGNASGTAVTVSGRITVNIVVEFFNRLLVTT